MQDSGLGIQGLPLPRHTRHDQGFQVTSSGLILRTELTKKYLDNNMRCVVDSIPG
jgi:hypothetical protein